MEIFDSKKMQEAFGRLDCQRGTLRFGEMCGERVINERGDSLSIAWIHSQMADFAMAKAELRMDDGSSMTVCYDAKTLKGLESMVELELAKMVHWRALRQMEMGEPTTRELSRWWRELRVLEKALELAQERADSQSVANARGAK